MEASTPGRKPSYSGEPNCVGMSSYMLARRTTLINREAFPFVSIISFKPTATP